MVGFISLNILLASYTRENCGIKEAVRVPKHKINGWDQLSLENEPYSMRKISLFYVIFNPKNKK
jgi:hypothetical protein